MKLTTRFFFLGLWWLFPLAAALGLYWRSGNYPVLDPAASVEDGRTVETLLFVIPLACAAAALAGARLRGAPHLRAPASRRGTIAWLSRIVIPIWLVGLLALITIDVVARCPARDGLAWQLWLHAVVSLLAWIILGLGLGVSASALFSAPAALALPYLALGFAPAMASMWPRHLIGAYDCCRAGDVLAPQALGALLLVSCAIAATGVALARRWYARTRFLPVGLVAAGSVILVYLAYLLVAGMDWYPGVPG